ncbi:hypothetical protein BHM03_00051959, partial [Ensete ventricosum]
CHVYIVGILLPSRITSTAAKKRQKHKMSGVTGSPLPKLEVEGVVFPPVVTPPGSTKAHFLGGAGLLHPLPFIAFTAIGVYLEDAAVQSLASNWKGKGADELADAVEFFRDIFGEFSRFLLKSMETGPFEKFTRVTLLKPLTGQQYANKVSENCTAQWKAAGVYTEADGAALEQFKEAFRAETFPPGSSILFTHAPSDSLLVHSLSHSAPSACTSLIPLVCPTSHSILTIMLQIAFSKDGSMPEAGNAVIQNQALSQAILESIIGEHGVSPAAKRSLAQRFSDLLKQHGEAEETKPVNPVAVIV